MAIGMGQVIRIGLKLVARREEIAETWRDLVPAIDTARRNYPKIKSLIDEIMPPGELEEGKQEPEAMTVEWLQELLNTLGADPELEVDGDYGEATKAAVAQFQTDHPPLVVDGWAGVQTQASIVEELAKV